MQMRMRLMVLMWHSVVGGLYDASNRGALRCVQPPSVC
jgi:hypothetical protein